MHHALLTIAQLAGTAPADITGTTATSPPGAKGFLWLVSVAIWFAFLAAMAGMAKAGGKLSFLGIKPSSHGGGNAVAEMACSGAGLIVIGSLGAIMTTIAALT